MKKDQNRINFNAENDFLSSPLAFLQREILFFKESIFCGIFQLYKAENEKLQIVYANIRV